MCSFTNENRTRKKKNHILSLHKCFCEVQKLERFGPFFLLFIAFLKQIKRELCWKKNRWKGAVLKLVWFVATSHASLKVLKSFCSSLFISFRFFCLGDKITCFFYFIFFVVLKREENFAFPFSCLFNALEPLLTVRLWCKMDEKQAYKLCHYRNNWRLWILWNTNF